MISSNAIYPINEWIIVEEVAPEDKTPSGIIIPIEVNKKQIIKTCTVIAISNDVARLCKEDEKELQYAVGDTVVHNSQLGLRLNPTDETDRTMLLRYDTVMAVFKKENTDE